MDNGPCQGLAQLVMYLCKPVTGIEPTGNMVKQPAKFTVDTISAGQGDVMVFVEDPEGNKEEVCGWMLPPQAASHGLLGLITGIVTVLPFSSLKLIPKYFVPKGSQGSRWLK